MKMHATGSLLTDHAMAGPSTEPSIWSRTKRLLNLVRSAVDGVVHWQQHRRSIRELQRLDDHLLADIGISRSEIEEGVRFGRWSRHDPDLDKLSCVVE
jgi:uncharacterized protein YjiS (DUF1127 family)